MPCAKTVKIGLWENGDFTGVIIFSLGAGNIASGKQYGLKRTHEVAELARIALKQHVTPVSKAISIALSMLKRQSPGIRLVVSFADEMAQGHLGKIYQAANFIYAGTFTGDGGFVINGKHYHSRSVYSKGWVQSEKWLRENIDQNARAEPTKKHRYLMPMDNEMRKKILPLAQPNPKG